MDDCPLPTFLCDLLVSGDFSDCTVTCQGHVFRVHRAILCKQSPFFNKVLNDTDAKPIVDVPNISPATVVRLLSYLYTRDYKENDDALFTWFTYPLVVEEKIDTPTTESEPPLEGENPAKDVPPACSGLDDTKTESFNSNGADDKAIAYNNLDLYSAADKIGVAGLKELAKERFVDWLEKNITHDEFLDVIQAVMKCWVSDKKPLMNAIGQVLSLHLSDIVNTEGMVSILSDFGPLASTLFKASMEENSQLRERNRQLEAELEEANEAKRQRDDDWKMLTQCINSRTGCRQCGESWGLRVDGYRFEYGTLRCRQCNTRHGPEHSFKHVDSFGYF